MARTPTLRANCCGWRRTGWRRSWSLTSPKDCFLRSLGIDGSKLFISKARATRVSFYSCAVGSMWTSSILWQRNLDFGKICFAFCSCRIIIPLSRAKDFLDTSEGMGLYRCEGGQARDSRKGMYLCTALNPEWKTNTLSTFQKRSTIRGQT